MNTSKVEWHQQGKTKILVENTIPLPLHSQKKFHILIFHDFITVPGMGKNCVVSVVIFSIPQLFISILGVLSRVKIEHLVW
jgi:hypothetical protein